MNMLSNHFIKEVNKGSKEEEYTLIRKNPYSVDAEPLPACCIGFVLALV